MMLPAWHKRKFTLPSGIKKLIKQKKKKAIKRSNICPLSHTHQTIKCGWRYLKNGDRQRKVYCYDCDSSFTSKIGLNAKIRRRRKTLETFRKFCIITDSLNAQKKPISSRKIKIMMLDEKISHVTINDWLKKTYPFIKR